MGSYGIVSARPRGETNHINSEFKLYEFDARADEWKGLGWKKIGYVSNLLQAGHEVLTGRIVDDTIKEGAAVELELRIAKNGTRYKISEMPDR